MSEPGTVESASQIEIDSPDQLRTHLKTRSGLFVTRLGAISLKTHQDPHTGKLYNPGWESILKDSDDSILKTPATAGPTSLFTGKAICQLGAFALFDSITSRTDAYNLRVLSINTDMTSENWRHPTKQYLLVAKGHYLVESTHKQTGEVLYLDPTYAQIDHRRAGEIVVATAAEFKHLYRGDTSSKPWDVTARREILHQAMTKYGITQKEYDSLVSTIT